MAHYAFVNDDNIVVDVIVGKDEEDLVDGITSWEDYYGEQRGLRCLRTSYNTLGNVHWSGEFDEEFDPIPSGDQSKAFRGNYAGIGFTYDEERDAFIAPKPGDDYILDEVTLIWNQVGNEEGQPEEA